jgi:hypothetical protein
MGSLDPGAIKQREFSPSLGVAILVLAMCLERLTNSTADPDLWGYLAFGRLYWNSGQFPFQDVFAYLPTLPRWVYHEWLSGVLFYPLFQAAGPVGLQLLKYGFGLATLGLVYLTARRRGADSMASLIFLLVIQGFLTSGYSPVRAQVFTFAFFALSLYLVETARLTGRWWRLLWLVPLQIFWANLHGGFLAGLGLVGLYALGEALSRRPFLPFVLIFLASGLATLINPYGGEYWHYLLRAVSMPRPYITEWASVFQNLRTGVSPGQTIYFFLVVFFSLYLAWRTRWRELTPILALGLTVYLGMMHQRHQIFFFLLGGAYLPARLSGFLEKMKSDSHVIAVCRYLGWKTPMAVGVLLVVLSTFKIVHHSPLTLYLPSLPEQITQSKIYYPVGAVEHIRKNHLSGNLLTEFDWGEYLIWTLYPQCRVSLDGRYETVYEEKVCDAYFNFIKGKAGWRNFLQQYPPELVLVKSQTRIYSLMHAEPGWREAYHDSGSALFLRQDKLVTPNSLKPSG